MEEVKLSMSLNLNQLNLLPFRAESGYRGYSHGHRQPSRDTVTATLILIPLSNQANQHAIEGRGVNNRSTMEFIVFLS